MKSALTLLIVTFFLKFAFAQNPVTRCATEVLPQQFEVLLEQWKNKNTEKLGGGTVQSVFNIPVIVHIIHNNEPVNTVNATTGGNLNAAQILDQINILNKDFNGLNDMNQLEVQAGKFHAHTHDMCTFKSDADIIINTSCEHITQDEYDLWLSGLPYNSLIVLQSNNYDIPEHVRTAKSLDEFTEQCGIKVLWAGELELPLYKRFMVIGKASNE